jgi:G3E family GTPase
VRLDGVITLADAESLVKYPQLGHTTTLQIEAADAIILNKIDLVDPMGLAQAEQRLQAVNPTASIIHAVRCQVDPDLLFGLGRARIQAPPQHVHQPEFESFSFISSDPFDIACFEAFANRLEPSVYRAKGFIQSADATYLFNFVTRRWDLEPFEPHSTELVFIGKQITEQKTHILDRLQACRKGEASI